MWSAADINVPRNICSEGADVGGDVDGGDGGVSRRCRSARAVDVDPDVVISGCSTTPSTSPRCPSARRSLVGGRR
jgi:hypothetical protein